MFAKINILVNTVNTMSLSLKSSPRRANANLIARMEESVLKGPRILAPHQSSKTCLSWGKIKSILNIVPAPQDTMALTAP